MRNDQPEFRRFEGRSHDDIPVDQLLVPADRPDNGTNGDGQFRVACVYSHFAEDDPVVFPGQPGRSHLHMFFGNTRTDARSTQNSLVNSGGGTCSGNELNRSAYWTPAVLDGRGNAVVPDYIIIYYKTKQPSKVRELPQGLQMVAGNIDKDSFTADQRLGWSCGASGTSYNLSNRIPTNCGNDPINAFVQFPNCWNGRDLTSKDLTSHLAFVAEERDCPSSHPVRLPQITILLYFPASNASGWHLSSDRSGGFNSGPGATLHADWFGAWHDEAISLWSNGCMRAARNCSFGQTGTNRQLARITKNDAYNGNNLIPLPKN